MSALNNPRADDRDLTEYQISTFRELQVVVTGLAAQYTQPAGIEKIKGDMVRSLNQYGVVVYAGGSFKELIPWHRVHKLVYNTRDFNIIAQLEGREEVRRGR